MNQVTDRSASARLTGASLRAMSSRTPLVWGGLVLFGLSAVVWLGGAFADVAVVRVPVRRAHVRPDPAVDRFVLRRDIPPPRWAGVAFIAVGIFLVSRTRRAMAKGSARGGARGRHRRTTTRATTSAVPRLCSTPTAGPSTLDVLVVDNASHDGSHAAAVAAHPWARLIENRRERVPLAGVEPWDPRDRRAVRASPEPRRRVSARDARRLLEVARDHPRPVRSARWCATPTARCTRAAGSCPSSARRWVTRSSGRSCRGTAGRVVPHGRTGTATSEREVDWIRARRCCSRARRSTRSGCSMSASSSTPRSWTCSRGCGDAGWSVLFTPELEVTSRGRGLHRTFAADAPRALAQRLQVLSRSTTRAAGGGRSCRSPGSCSAFAPRSSRSGTWRRVGCVG